VSFKTLGLSESVLRAVIEQGYEHPTPIQSQVIPVIISGQDVMAVAQTGTGKTAGFTLPMLHRLEPFASPSSSPAKHPIRVLVLTPTRELAAQVEESIKTYGRFLPLKTVVIYGGMPMGAQVLQIQQGAEIVVATPGRLLDHVQQKSIQLNQVQMLVIDEADRMLDMGFIQDIRKIVALLPNQRQNLMFSATFSGEIQQLALTLLNNPTIIQVARQNATSENIQQWAYLVPQDQKRETLVRLIQELSVSQALVFTRTKQGADRLHTFLTQKGIHAEAIHGDKVQSNRTQSLERFKNGLIKILVATDVAARGLDIEALPFVFNFDVPHVPEDYVHRIGRTGRAGVAGHAITLVSPEEQKELQSIEKLISQKIVIQSFAKKETIDDTDSHTPTQESASPTMGRFSRPPGSMNIGKKPSEIPFLLKSAPPKVLA
jgi:ATP-dependent RNA helicase RhlE